MDRIKLLEMNNKHGDSLIFQCLLRDKLKKEFEAEIINFKFEQKRRVQNG